jgi:hypothetical protein
MNRTFLIFLLLLTGQVATAQSRTVRVNVYFASDKHQLQANQRHTLDTLADFLEGKDVKWVTLTGHTDSDADSLYNLELSQRRMEVVRNYLVGRSLPASVFRSGYLGESRPVADNEHEQGKQKNRRVEITVVYKEKEILEEPKVVEKPVVAPKVAQPVVAAVIDTCARDTMIYLPQGTRYLISICDYRKYKDCIHVREFLTPESILSSNLTTVTSRNEQLITGGMFDVRICDGNPPLVHPLIFRVPVPNNGAPPPEGGCGPEVNFRKMSLWTRRSDGAWEGSRNINLQKSADSLFYEFRVTQSGTYNLDYKADQKNLTKVKVKFKARGKVKLISVRLLYTSPQTVFAQNANKSGRKVKFVLPRCPANGCACILVEAWGVTRDNDTVMTTGCLNGYKKRLLFGKCKLKSGKEVAMGFIPVSRKAVYRKYFFLRSDWKSQPRLSAGAGRAKTL